MSDVSRDRIEGTVDEGVGRAKSAFGDFTGDEQTQAEGDAQELSGHAKQGLANVKDALGDAKDKVDDLVKKATGND